MMATHKMAKVQSEAGDGDGYVFKLDDLQRELSNLLDDDSLEAEYVFTVKRIPDMTDEEIAALPEFKGF